MKKSALLAFLFLMVTHTTFAFVTMANSYKINQKTVLFDNFMRFSPQEIQNQTGQKLGIFEKLGFKIIQRKLKKMGVNNPPECSKIVMKDGDVIEANVLQITPTEIKYKRCGKPNDPEIVVNKKDVLSIKAADGEIIFRNLGNNSPNETTNTPTNRDNNYGTNATQNTNSNEPKLEGNALAGMICGILGVLFLGGILSLALGITGLVLSLIGRRKINNDPKRYKGKGMALAGLICGIVACGLFALALLSAV
jgi:Domain of unknown function (DUF4190)